MFLFLLYNIQKLTTKIHIHLITTDIDGEKDK